MHESEFCMVYVTAPSREEARRIADSLVEERYAACVNILGGIESCYWWEGSVQHEEEVALVAKTTSQGVDPLMKRVTELHSHECPCIVTIPLSRLHEPFARWLDDQMSPVVPGK